MSPTGATEAGGQSGLPLPGSGLGPAHGTAPPLAQPEQDWKQGAVPRRAWKAEQGCSHPWKQIGQLWGALIMRSHSASQPADGRQAQPSL